MLYKCEWIEIRPVVHAFQQRHKDREEELQRRETQKVEVKELGGDLVLGIWGRKKSRTCIKRKWIS